MTADERGNLQTRKARFLTAIRGGQPDRAPMFDFLFQQPLYEELIGHRPGTYNARDAVACALALDHDAVWLPFGGFNGFLPKFLDANTYVNEWGTTYRHNDASWPINAPIDYPIKSRQDLARYRPPDPTLPGRTAELEAFWEAEHDDLALTGGVTGPFITCWLLMGYELAFAMRSTTIPTCSSRYSNSPTPSTWRRPAAASRRVVTPWVSDNLGDSSHGFLKLEHFRDLYLPYLAELVGYVDSLGAPALLHSCGHFTDYLPDLAQTKIAAIHPLQRTAGMDLGWVKEHYGKRFCIIGNIDSSRTLPFGTPADVAAEVREAIDIAAPGGGYVLASDHSLHDGIPLENIRTMFRVGREYGGRCRVDA